MQKAPHSYFSLLRKVSCDLTVYKNEFNISLDLDQLNIARRITKAFKNFPSHHTSKIKNSFYKKFKLKFNNEFYEKKIYTKRISRQSEKLIPFLREPKYTFTIKIINPTFSLSQWLLKWDMHPDFNFSGIPNNDLYCFLQSYRNLCFSCGKFYHVNWVQRQNFFYRERSFYHTHIPNNCCSNDFMSVHNNLMFISDTPSSKLKDCT